MRWVTNERYNHRKYAKLLAFTHEITCNPHDCHGLICYPCEAEKLLKEIGEE